MNSPVNTDGRDAGGRDADGRDADGRDDGDAETYNPWTIVNIVFSHLAEEGLHPQLGEGGDPGEPARALLIALGIQPRAEGNREVMRKVHDHLAEIRTVVFESD